VLTVGDHAHRPAQVDDPVEPNLVALSGGLFDAESGLFIAQRVTVMAVGAAKQQQDLVAVRVARALGPFGQPLTI
jgi:hypothetical protein